MELYEPGSEHPKDVEYANGAIEAFKKYVQLQPETEKAREVAYHFVMAHEYEDGEHRREEKWTH